MSSEPPRDDWCICGEPQGLHEANLNYCRKIKNGKPCYCEAFTSEADSEAKRKQREKLKPVPVQAPSAPTPVYKPVGLETWL